MDRALVNQGWLDKFPTSYAEFLPPGISDHSPIVIHVVTPARKKGTPFRFYNYWTSLDRFSAIVHDIWSRPIDGNFQFQLCHKLRNLKGGLKTLAKDSRGREKLLADLAREKLMHCQQDLESQPSNTSLRAQEKLLMGDFLEALRVEEEVMRQKSRIQWLEAGDRNTAYFHNSIKNRRNRKRIVSLIQPNGLQTITEDATKFEAIRYFKSMLGSTINTPSPGVIELRSIIQKRISNEHVTFLESIPTIEEIKDTMFSLHSNKAPGPDGFNAFFFKETWAVTGPLVTKAISEFFITGEILGESNATLIALIPKVPNPSSMSDFRPISCCNTIYKCISKIISKKLQVLLPDLVDKAQSAFIKGRKISDNVLLAQDLLRDYHKNGGHPRIAAKVDLMKAYDTVSWDFLFDLLDVFGFPPNLQKWIKACVSSPRYSINFNGESIGYFSGAKGLRQGDPMSPYLFILIMDALSQLITYNIQNSPEFKYHWKCDKLHISHLCFADDLLLLFHGDLQSALLMKNTLTQFHSFSGLCANPSKSCIFFAGVDDTIANSVCQALQFNRGSLPLKYLGVPLIPTRLKKVDCDELIKKISNRVQSWTSKFLSYAGRLQLIQSVLAGIQNYWASMFILPKYVLKQVEKIMRRFLWSGGIEKASGAKVAWDSICKPKKEGGLGFKPLIPLNCILNMKHIWALFSNKNQSLWASWIHTYMLKGKSFWAVKPPSQCSWYWRKLPKLRDKVRPLLKHKIGNGSDTFLWYDNWHPLGPLVKKFGQRIAYDAALPLHAKVKDIIEEGEWQWPYSFSPALMEVRAVMHLLPSPSGSQDTVLWIPSPHGQFTSSHTWAHLRNPTPKVPWYRLVWFPGNIPRHSFIMWLAILNRLSTHDRIYTFTQGPLACVLCHAGMESHDHLFFGCSFSSFVWQGILHRLELSHSAPSWGSLVNWATGTWKKKTPSHTIAKMCLESTVYHIWRERNARTFRMDAKPKERVLCDICLQISYQIQIKWKNDPHLSLIVDRWNRNQ